MCDAPVIITRPPNHSLMGVGLTTPGSEKIIEGVIVRRGVTKVYPKKRERVPDDPDEFNGWLHALFPVRQPRWDPMALDPH